MYLLSAEIIGEYSPPSIELIEAIGCIFIELSEFLLIISIKSSTFLFS